MLAEVALPFCKNSMLVPPTLQLFPDLGGHSQISPRALLSSVLATVKVPVGTEPHEVVVAILFIIVDVKS